MYRVHDPTQLVDSIVIFEKMNEDTEIWFKAKRPLTRDAHYNILTFLVLGR